MDISVSRAEIKDINKRLKKTLRSVTGDDKKEILEKAGKLVAIKSRRLAPVGKARKTLKGAASATYSQGKIKTKYYPLALKRSLRVLNLKKTTDAVVGPRIAKKAGRSYGKNPKTSSAYYAQIIFGSAQAFKRRITGKALKDKQGAVFALIDKEVSRKLSAAKKRNRL
jgi:hypothetical protein